MLVAWECQFPAFRLTGSLHVRVYTYVLCRVSILRRNAYNAAKVPFSYRNWITCLSSTWTTMSWNPCLLIYQKVYVYFTFRYDRPSHSLWPPYELLRVSRRTPQQTHTHRCILPVTSIHAEPHTLPCPEPWLCPEHHESTSSLRYEAVSQRFVPSCALSVS